MDELVLVTGGTGFIAQHCIIALANAGYRVRTTVRSLSREAEVRANLKTGGAEPGERLSFVVADLSSDEGWAEAAAGCSYAFHGASPTPSGTYANEDEWIKPAVDGNLRVLRAARDAGVKRVVLTSAFGAIGAGHKPLGRPFVETDWTDLTGNVAPYQKSKTLAERASWDFIEREGGGLELASVNPTMVLGPALGPDYSHSIRTIREMLEGQPGYPKIKTCVVDVRDVADLHLRAMTDPAAKGERFLATSGEGLWLAEIAERCRKYILASKIAIGGGAALLLITILGLLGTGQTAALGSIALVLGGIVSLGSNISTLRQTDEAIGAAEARRAALISSIDLRLVADTPLKLV